jgi:hypothetical protein
MPDTALFLMSLVCLAVAVLLVLFPRLLLSQSRSLSRKLAVLDVRMMRYRYALSLLLVAVSYGLFRLALLFLAHQGPWS